MGIIDDIEARVRPTIGTTFVQHSGEIAARISVRDFETLLELLRRSTTLIEQVAETESYHAALRLAAMPCAGSA